MFLSWLERKYSYYPTKDISDEILQFNLESCEVKLSSRASTWLYFYRGKPDAPLVIFSHGNRGNVGCYCWCYNFLASLGVSFITYDYPGYGKSKGKCSEKNLYLSGEAAYRYARDTLHFKPQDIVQYGLSLGGAVALDIASKNPSRCAVIECTFTEGHAMAKKIFPKIPITKVIPNRFQNIKKISKLKMPVLIVHGTDDPTIPVGMAYELYEQAAHPKDLYILEGGEHANLGIIGGEEFKQRIKDFIFTKS